MKDPYVYEGTNVLKNKFNIKDEKELDKVESDFVTLALISLKKSNFEFNSIFDGLKIHKLLFNKIYNWAGSIRIIDIYKREPLLGGKSIDYVFASYIEEYLLALDKEFKNVNFELLNKEEKINKVCYFVSEFWHIHPFREGNTRTSSMMLYFLIKKLNLHINIDFISRNAKYFRNALVLSCLYSLSKKEYLLGIVVDSTTFKNTKHKKYETIEGIEVAKYSYTNHTVDKLKTIDKI